MTDKTRIRNRALRYLAARDLSRFQLRKKLLPHAASPDSVNEALDELESRGLINDAAYARDRAFFLRRHKKWGDARIRLNLKRHGISATIIDRTLTEVELELTEASCLQEVIEKWTRRFGQPARASDVQKLQRHCLRRGFPQAKVRSCLDTFLAGLDWDK